MSEIPKTIRTSGGSKPMSSDMTMAGAGYNGPYPGVTHQDGSIPPMKPDISPAGTELGLKTIDNPFTKED